jgi:phage-related protein
MSKLTYNDLEVSVKLGHEKPLVWLKNEIKTPPFSAEGRLRAGLLLRRLQNGEKLQMPDSRPMPSIGSGCHELRVDDVEMRKTWRIIYKIKEDAIVIGEVFEKKTQKTPQNIIEVSKRRFRLYDLAVGDKDE